MPCSHNDHTFEITFGDPVQQSIEQPVFILWTDILETVKEANYTPLLQRKVAQVFSKGAYQAVPHKRRAQFIMA
jgi:hypothetical protein